MKWDGDWHKGIRKMDKSDVFDLELARNTIQSAKGLIFYLNLDDATVEDDKLILTAKTDENHLNTEGVVQGGILYTICDQAMAVYDIASGTRGLGTEGSIHHYRPAKAGDVLRVVVSNRKRGRTTSTYLVELYNQNEKLIADAMFTAFYGTRQN